MKNRDGDVNYSSYSNEELREAFEGINPNTFPMNFKNLSDEMTMRGISVDHFNDKTIFFSDFDRMTKIRHIIAMTIFISIYCIFFYGAIRFPDGVEPCGTNQYCGKQGQPHTLEDFRAFSLWEKTFLYGLPCGLLAICFLVRKRGA